MIGYIFIFVALAVVGFTIFILMQDSSSNKDKKSDGKPKVKDEGNKKRNKEKTVTLDSKDILDFDSIIQVSKEHALIKINNSKYVGIIQVKGVPYNLLSLDERIRLEENFQSLLNGINYKFQICVFSRNLELDTYRSRYESFLNKKELDMKKLKERIEYSNNEEEIKLLSELYQKKRNQVEIYGKTWLNYFDVSTTNAHLLEENYYIVLQHMHNSRDYEAQLSEDEKIEIAFNEINNKFSLIENILSRCDLKCKFLDCVSVANVLYTSYNKDGSNALKLKNAIRGRYSHISSTSKTIDSKKVDLMVEEGEKELKKIEQQMLKESGN
ncbi:MAG: hypothetical protein ACLS2V_12950 [Clostridium paraputrificum]|uniref:hypothetical protein n=1 Tax=Clostridium sp. TaxID=1506 RepID=UPI0025C1ACAB|nr:hypothetical protein [Clostridium sp.]MBS5926223.1 hypothetical protein [Clostridium sp.]